MPVQIRESDFVNLRVKLQTSIIYVQSTVRILSQYARNIFIVVLLSFVFNTGSGVKAVPVLNSAQLKGI